MTMRQMYPAVVNSPGTELAADITATDTEITVLSASGLPPAPNLLTIGSDETAETVRYTAIEGDVLTVERGFQGTAKAWSAGTKLARNFTAYDHDAFVGNIEEHVSDSDVHVTVEKKAEWDGKETPEGAQIKADEAQAVAEQNANTYTNGYAAPKVHEHAASAITTGTIAAARLPSASVSAAGISKLNNTITSSSTTEAAAAAAVKQVNDKFSNMIRVNDGKLEYFDGSQWKQAGGGGVKYLVNSNTTQDTWTGNISVLAAPDHSGQGQYSRKVMTFYPKGTGTVDLYVRINSTMSRPLILFSYDADIWGGSTEKSRPVARILIGEMLSLLDDTVPSGTTIKLGTNDADGSSGKWGSVLYFPAMTANQYTKVITLNVTKNRPIYICLAHKSPSSGDPYGNLTGIQFKYDIKE